MGNRLDVENVKWVHKIEVEVEAPPLLYLYLYLYLYLFLSGRYEACLCTKRSAGRVFSFEVDPFAKHCLLNGLDDIDWTLEFAEQISAYEQQARTQAPWTFLGS